MLDPTAILLALIAIGGPLATLLTLALAFRSYKLQAKELEIRHLEAQAKLLAARDDVPDWLDKDDPAALTEWKRARAELNRVTAQAAARRSL